MSLVGHEGIARVLTSKLPPVALFSGPYSVGKWTTAEWLRREHAIQDGDTLRVHKLTIGEAEKVRRFLSMAPVGSQKLAIVRLDERSPGSFGALLKMLEELPEHSHIILITSHPVPMSIMSRSQQFEFGVLSDAEVQQVLLNKNFNSAAAVKLAARAHGHVSDALRDNVNDQKVTVLAALNAIRTKDAATLDTISGRWTDEHTELLLEMCRELVTHRWSTFSEAELEGVKRRLGLKILYRTLPVVRPRLVVRSQLMSVLQEE